MTRRPHAALSLLLALCCATPAAQAEMWCADPLWVHEWGVQVFDGSGAPSASPALPGYFHRSAPPVTTVANPVRALPADSGQRALPVVQIYTGGAWTDQDIPFALEVGFDAGHPTVWYPQVDEAGPASLRWDALTLKQSTSRPPEQTASPWVGDLRAVDGALWVERGDEAERFIFYEGETRERPLLDVIRGDSWSEERAHYRLVNTSAFPVHDVFVVHTTGDARAVFFAATIPAGASAGFLLEPSATEPERYREATRGRLTTLLTDSAQPEPPEDYRWDLDACVMGRDPAEPFTQTEDHRLYRAEVEAMLDVWAPRFFESEGTTLIYRESNAYLEQALPMAVYTDMYHFVKLRRASLVMWEHLDLVSLSAP